MGRTSEEVRLELERRKEEKRSVTTLRGRGNSSLASLLNNSSSSSFLKRPQDQVTSKVQGKKRMEYFYINQLKLQSIINRDNQSELV